MQFLFAALIFLVVFLAVALVVAYTGQEMPSDIVRGRLETIQKGVASTQKLGSTDLIRDDLLSSIPSVNKLLARWSWAGQLKKLIAQAGMDMKPGKLLLICLVVGFVGMEATDLLAKNFLFAVCVGIPCLFLPIVYVLIRRLRRMHAFERQFPEAIDLLGRSVRAGHSFTSGMEIIATDLPDPIATEFRTTFDEQRFGLPMRDALLNLCDRVPLIDVRIFVTALLVQRETGGNLVEILDNLAHVIRERFRIAGEVRIRTAQGRLSAAILMILPIAVLVILRFMSPDYIGVLFTETLGRYLLIFAGLLQLFGAFVIWRIIQIRV
jgi:tight adherence protein B